MSSKFCISINEEKNAINTKGKASKVAASAVTNPPNRCKHGNPGYVDGGGDKKNEENQFSEASFLVVQSSNVVSEISTIDQHKMLSDALSSFKELADRAEENARNREKTLQCAVEQASDRRVRAEEMRKKVADTEKYIIKVISLESDTSSRRMLTDYLHKLKKLADDEEENARIHETEILYAKEQASVCAEKSRKICADKENFLSETLLRLFGDTLPGMKKSADLAEESARNCESISAGLPKLSI